MKWQLLTDQKEKYAAYLTSREWGLKREAVHQRAGGKCERCGGHPLEAVHHLTYIRKYDERLEDLQGLCRGCHDFTHGRSEDDPLSEREAYYQFVLSRIDFEWDLFTLLAKYDLSICSGDISVKRDDGKYCFKHEVEEDTLNDFASRYKTRNKTTLHLQFTEEAFLALYDSLPDDLKDRMLTTLTCATDAIQCREIRKRFSMNEKEDKVCSAVAPCR